MQLLTDNKRPTIKPKAEAAGQLREKYHQGGNGGSHLGSKARHRLGLFPLRLTMLVWSPEPRIQHLAHLSQSSF
jgi:hypothetical protein